MANAYYPSQTSASFPGIDEVYPPQKDADYKVSTLLKKLGLPVVASLIVGGMIGASLMHSYDHDITEKKKQAHEVVEQMYLDLQDVSERQYGDKKTHVISDASAMMQRDDLGSILRRAETLNSIAIVDESDALMAARYLSAARKVYVPNADAEQANITGQLAVLLDKIPNALARDPSLLP